MIQKNKKGYRNLQSKFNLIVLTVFLLTTLLIQSTIAFTPDDINTVIKQLTTMRDDSLKSSIGSAVSETDFERIKTSTAFIAASKENKYIEELYNQRYKRAQENNFGEGSWIGDNWFYLLLIPLFGVGAFLLYKRRKNRPANQTKDSLLDLLKGISNNEKQRKSSIKQISENLKEEQPKFNDTESIMNKLCEHIRETVGEELAVIKDNEKPLETGINQLKRLNENELALVETTILDTIKKDVEQIEHLESHSKIAGHVERFNNISETFEQHADILNNLPNITNNENNILTELKTTLNQNLTEFNEFAETCKKMDSLLKDELTNVHKLEKGKENYETTVKTIRLLREKSIRLHQIFIRKIALFKNILDKMREIETEIDELHQTEIERIKQYLQSARQAAADSHPDKATYFARLVLENAEHLDHQTLTDTTKAKLQTLESDAKSLFMDKIPEAFEIYSNHCEELIKKARLKADSNNPKDAKELLHEVIGHGVHAENSRRVAQKVATETSADLSTVNSHAKFIELRNAIADAELKIVESDEIKATDKDKALELLRDAKKEAERLTDCSEVTILKDRIDERISQINHKEIHDTIKELLNEAKDLAKAAITKEQIEQLNSKIEQIKEEQKKLTLPKYKTKIQELEDLVNSLLPVLEKIKKAEEHLTLDEKEEARTKYAEALTLADSITQDKKKEQIKKIINEKIKALNHETHNKIKSLIEQSKTLAKTATTKDQFEDILDNMQEAKAEQTKLGITKYNSKIQELIDLANAIIKVLDKLAEGEDEEAISEKEEAEKKYKEALTLAEAIPDRKKKKEFKRIINDKLKRFKLDGHNKIKALINQAKTIIELPEPTTKQLEKTLEDMQEAKAEQTKLGITKYNSQIQELKNLANELIPVLEKIEEAQEHENDLETQEANTKYTEALDLADSITNTKKKDQIKKQIKEKLKRFRHEHKIVKFIKETDDLIVLAKDLDENYKLNKRLSFETTIKDYPSKKLSEYFEFSTSELLMKNIPLLLSRLKELYYILFKLEKENNKINLENIFEKIIQDTQHQINIAQLNMGLSPDPELNKERTNKAQTLKYLLENFNKQLTSWKSELESESKPTES